MSTKALLGQEGGKQPVILLWCRRPWGVYFSIRTPVIWKWDLFSKYYRVYRFRIGIGPAFKWLHLGYSAWKHNRTFTVRAWRGE